MKTALVVDDVSINRELLKDMLEDEYAVLEAADGEEALSIIKERGTSISVLLLDLVMPKLDGFGVLKGLKSLGIHEHFPVLIITGESGQDTERVCLLEGATDFIKKPFNPGLVRQRVKNATALFDYKNKLEEKVAEQTAKLKVQAEELEIKNRWLEKRNDKTVELLSSVVEARSLESGTHVKRVKLFSQLLAEKVAQLCPEYGLNKEMVNVIASASAMHDVGKITVSDAILNKPGKLTPEEFEEMKRHTVYGVNVLDETRDLWDADFYRACREICLSHHERWNGAGYPQALKGDEIPISAQIVSIADCYDALTTERVYKKAFLPEVAFRMIRDGECGVFNPKLLKCFLECEESFALTAASIIKED